MAWSNSAGRDLSHHNTIGNYTQARNATDWVQIKLTEDTGYLDPAGALHYRGFAGKPRGAYHFARPGNIAAQVSHFLAVKKAVGKWERPDMLDCEFPGVTGAFIRNMVSEYRHQSGIRLVLVYVGLADLEGACRPALWWDKDTPIWAARYRKIGPPKTPDSWAMHLGWDHPGLAIYQWDDATPLPGGGNTDISYQRVALGAAKETDMELGDKFDRALWNDKPGTLGWTIENLMQDTDALRLLGTNTKAAAEAARTAIASLTEQIEFKVAEAVANYLQANPPVVNQTVSDADRSAIAAAVVAEFKKEGN